MPEETPAITTPPTDTPQGVDKQAISELATAMQELRVSVDNSSLSSTRPNPSPISGSSSSDEPSPEVDFTDPVAVKKYIKEEMVKVKTEANKAYITDQARRMYDQLVDQDFPDLQNPSSPLYKETLKEVRKRMGVEGISGIEEMRQKNPAIFYDAAASASIRLQKGAPRAGNPENRRLSGLTGGFIEGGGNPPPPPPPKSEVTSEQRYFADKFGIDQKVLSSIPKYIKGSDGTYRLSSED